MDIIQLSGLSALGGIIGVCLLITLVRFSSAWKAAKSNAIAAKLIDRHIEALYRRRRTILIPDDYGAIRNKFKAERDREKEHFIQNVVHPELVRTGRRSWIPYLNEALFHSTLDQKLADYEVDRSEDAEIAGPIASGTDYEYLCAALLRKAGWSTQMTRGSGDQGADIIAECGDRRIVVQCKFYAKSVGNKAVQEVVAAKQFVGADVAIVASNQTFAGSARRLVAANGVLLLHHEQLIRGFHRSDAGSM